MRRYSLGFVLLFLVCVSCTDIGGDEKFNYSHYISNKTDKVIGIKVHGGADIIEPGQSVDFGITVSGSVSGSGCNPSGVFNISSRDGQVRVIFNDSIELNVPSKTGYTFKEWNSQADGNGTSYNIGDKVTNLSNEQSATVQLYAIWEDTITPTTTAPTGIFNILKT